MRQRELEMALQRLGQFPAPKAELEQYPTPAPIAAEVLYLAKGLGDIEGRSVVDLGCGTGPLAIGASLLGAGPVSAIDVDAGAVEVAREGAAMLGADVDFHVGDVSTMTGSYDTVLQNPPFGAQRKGADIPFNEKTVELGTSAIYTFFNPPSRDYLARWFGERGWSPSHEKNYRFDVKHTFHFHSRERKRLEVGLFRLTPESR